MIVNDRMLILCDQYRVSIYKWDSTTNRFSIDY